MKWWKQISIAIIVLFYIFCCNQPSDTDSAYLQGSWKETFDWVSPWAGAVINAPSGELAVKRTSVITFTEDSLLVTVLPPAPDWAFPDSTDAEGNYVDEAGIKYTSATCYSASYTTTDDRIFVLPDGKTKPLKFGFYIRKNELTLTALGEKDSTESMGHPNFSFVWDYALIRSIGTFEKQ